jgi:hypothetical protein
MSHNDELAAKYPDLLPTAGENRPEDPELALLIADLDSRLAGTLPPPTELKERIAAALQVRATEIRTATPERRSLERATTGPEYLQPIGGGPQAGLRSSRGGPQAGRGGQAIMAPRRLSIFAAAIAAVLVVSLIGILLYSMRGAGTSGSGAFQQRLLELGGTQVLLGRSPGSAPTPPISADIPIIEHRLASRIAPADTQVRADSTSDRLIIDIAGQTGGLQQILTLVGAKGQANFIDTGSTPLPIGTDVTGMTCTTSCQAGQYKIVFTGEQLDPNSISAQTDPASNQPVVTFEFQGAARSAFATYTQTNVGNYLTITLDNKVIEAAVINSSITGPGQISGGYMTVADAQNLASFLKSGALPVPLKVISVSSFQPGTPAPTVVSCPAPTPTSTPIPPLATPFATPTATPGNSGAEIRVPDVVGEQFGQAVLNIEQVGLQAVGMAQVDSHVAIGHVIKTSPPAGTLVTTSQVVTIYYSAPQPTATPFATPTATLGNSGTSSSTSISTAEATAGPEGACTTPTPFPTAIATATAFPQPETPTPTPGGP